MGRGVGTQFPGRAPGRKLLCPAKDCQKRAKLIRLLLLDVDGVLTDGQILYDGSGRELKSFNIQDGHGIKLLQRAGLEVGILSGRRSAAVRLRAKELGIRLLRQRVLDKEKALEAILRRKGITAGQICFLGDDLVDLPVLAQVSLAVAVPDSVEDVKTNAHYITHRPGGKGAVREVCDLILKAQGKWKAATENYFRPLR
jgi:3-deoxy-D-manno-octulosonate 8-phosphate phosphatase (KDO 8-P phosphatase)